MDDFWLPSPRHQDHQHNNNTTSQQSDPQPRLRHDIQTDNYPEVNLEDLVSAILNEMHRQNILTFDELYERQQSEQRRQELIEAALLARWTHQTAQDPELLNADFVRRLIRLNQPINDLSRTSQQTQPQHSRMTSRYN
jgi:hypothetical protein